SSGNAYVAGDTRDAVFPLVNPIRTDVGIGFNEFTAFVSEIDPNGSSLLFSTYFSGTQGTSQTSLALGPGNTVYITGDTHDGDLPTTLGAFQEVPPPFNPFLGFEGPYVARIDANATAPAVCRSPRFLLFPFTNVGATSAPLTGTVTNCGDAGLTFSSVVLDPGPFQLTNNTCGAPLAIGASCSFTAIFVPTVNGPANVDLTFTDNAAIPVQKFHMSGFGVAPLLSVPPSVVFDQSLIGIALHRSFTVKNVGVLDIHFFSIAASP